MRKGCGSFSSHSATANPVNQERPDRFEKRTGVTNPKSCQARLVRTSAYSVCKGRHGECRCLFTKVSFAACCHLCWRAVWSCWRPCRNAWRAGAFAWNAGYWGPRVGFYGGINYGGGYFGSGFYGGRWLGRNYNVTNVTHVNRVEPTTSFNGGPGGVRVEATPAQLAMAKMEHPPLPQEQVTHVEQASHNRELHAFANRGAPPVAATRQAADFAPQSVVAARSAGVASPEAERHNARVRENPAQANGAALPRGDNPAGNPAHERQALVPDRPVSPSAALPDVQEAKPPAENRVRSDQKARDVPSQRAQQPVPDQAHPRRMQAPRDDGQANPDLRPRHP